MKKDFTKLHEPQEILYNKLIAMYVRVTQGNINNIVIIFVYGWSRPIFSFNQNIQYGSLNGIRYIMKNTRLSRRIFSEYTYLLK